MTTARAVLPPVQPKCSMTVAIPARNEERLIGHTLAAFGDQCADDGSRVDPRTFELIVYCNDCVDRTADVVRDFARKTPAITVHVVEERLPLGVAHIGTARRNALELAARRFAEAGRPDGIVASTDADTVVSQAWVAAVFREMRGVEAVAGFVSVTASDRDAMFAPLRLLYDRELVYRRLIGRAEAHFDPRPYDPFPRHDSFVGANFATTAAAYRRVGGLPPLPRLEDLAFARALERGDARVRHSYDMCATTSARSIARVDGGFATFLTDLSSLGDRHADYLVRSAREIIENAAARALARDAWRGEISADRLRALAKLVESDAAELRRATRRSETFGAFWSDLQSSAPQRIYPLESVQSAIWGLRRAFDERIPFAPTRSNVASGAG